MLKEMSNLQFGEFTLNLRLRELRRQEKVLPVSGKAFDLLVYMASNPGRPLTKTELLDAVWAGVSGRRVESEPECFPVAEGAGVGPRRTRQEWVHQDSGGARVPVCGRGG